MMFLLYSSGVTLSNNNGGDFAFVFDFFTPMRYNQGKARPRGGRKEGWP